MTLAGARTAGTGEKFLLAERWIRGESFVYESSLKEWGRVNGGFAGVLAACGRA
jgi:hypothetical protein